MPNFETDYKINNENLRWLSPIIKQWLLMHKNYMKVHEYKDSMYWYNERANIGVLAGAAWRCSGFALEEYSCKKGKGNDKSNGRTDLYISLGDDDAIIEGKMHWAHMHDNGSIGNYHQGIIETHKNSKEDIKRTLSQAIEDQGIALTFIGPYWRDGKDMQSQTKGLKKILFDSNYDLVAWLQNKSGNDLVSNTGYTYNGIALICNIIDSE